MAQYVNISMRTEDFDTIIQSLMDKTVEKETFFEINELVSLINRLYDEYDEDMNAKNLKLYKEEGEENGA